MCLDFSRKSQVILQIKVTLNQEMRYMHEQSLENGNPMSFKLLFEAISTSKSYLSLDPQLRIHQRKKKEM
jgi:hypothetical protein